MDVAEAAQMLCRQDAAASWQLIAILNTFRACGSCDLAVCYWSLFAEISAGEKVGIKMFSSVY